VKNMIFKAIEFAAKAHNGQFRKGTQIPYIYHPMGVARKLIEHNYSGNIVIAGLLHDTIEDTLVTEADIRRDFNKEIADLVVGASEKNRLDSWENRKKDTIKKLAKAPHDLLVLSCADKLDNINEIARDYKKMGESLWDRFNQPGKKQKWYYTGLSRVFSDRINEFDFFFLAEEFIQAVKNMFEQQAPEI